MKRYFFLLILSACIIFPTLASATPVLQVSDGVNWVYANPVDGVVEITNTWVGSTWNINSLVGVLNPNGFTLNGNIASIRAGMLTITLTESGLSGGYHEFPFNIGFDYSSEYLEARPPVFGTLTSTVYLNGNALDPVNDVALAVPGDPYTLKNVITIQNPSSLYNYFDSSVSMDPIPEPSSLILLGSGLIGTCLFFRRKN
jgi:hypothetical protein